MLNGKSKEMNFYRIPNSFTKQKNRYYDFEK